MTRLPATHPAVRSVTRSESDLEAAFIAELRRIAPHVPPPEREYIFAAPRRWRFDFAWPARRVAVEAEGGVWSGGRHVRPEGFERDVEKYNCATAEGWRVLRCTRKMLDADPAAFIGLLLDVMEAPE